MRENRSLRGYRDAELGLKSPVLVALVPGSPARVDLARPERLHCSSVRDVRRLAPSYAAFVVKGR